MNDIAEMTKGRKGQSPPTALCHARAIRTSQQAAKSSCVECERAASINSNIEVAEKGFRTSYESATLGKKIPWKHGAKYSRKGSSDRDGETPADRKGYPTNLGT